MNNSLFLEFELRTVQPVAIPSTEWAIQTHNEIYRDIILSENIYPYSENVLNGLMAHMKHFFGRDLTLATRIHTPGTLTENFLWRKMYSVTSGSL